MAKFRPGTHARWTPLSSCARDVLVVADHFGDDEVEELLREHRVEAGFFGEGAQPGDLLLFPAGIRGGKAGAGFELAHFLRAFEPCGEQGQERWGEVVETHADAR